MRWSGSIYGPGLARALRLRRERVGYGTWGSAPFQSIYAPAAGLLGCIFLMPEWYLIVAALGALAALGVVWAPLLATLPVLALALVATLAPAVAGGLRASFPTPGWPRGQRLALRLL